MIMMETSVTVKAQRVFQILHIPSPDEMIVVEEFQIRNDPFNNLTQIRWDLSEATCRILHVIIRTVIRLTGCCGCRVQRGVRLVCRMQ